MVSEADFNADHDFERADESGEEQPKKKPLGGMPCR